MRKAVIASAATLWITSAGNAAQAPPTSVIVSQQSLKLEKAGEGILHLTARAPNCSWGKKGAESAVVSVTLDGGVSREVVLFNGDKAHTYDLLLGPVTAGTHQLKIAFRPDLSPEGAQKVIVDKARAEVVAPGDTRYTAIANMPYLYGRNDNAASDTPLITTYESRDAGEGKRRLIYTVIFSNEDGGTGNDLGSLVARWGRSSDIEWVYDVVVGPDSKAQSAVIQAAGHKIVPFQGRYEGRHPILRTATTNNMVSDAGQSPFLFALAPLRETFPNREPREALMDDTPWSHRIAAEEMRRESKWEKNPDPNTLAASDIRHYLQVNYEARVSGGAALAVQVRLKNGRVFLSNHGREGDAIARSGWLRTTIELPAETSPKDIVGIAFVRADVGSAAGLATVSAVRAFLFNGDFRPREPQFRWSGAPLDIVPGPPVLVPDT
ncbi:MAG: hypothetical protein V4671_32340 [Armatimonadota bacterium]